MLTICYSPKGGQGCSTVAAALALATPDTLLIDAGGDLPALLGHPEPAGPGVGDLLDSTSTINPATLARLVIDAGPVRLVPAGDTPAQQVPAHRWVELATVINAGGCPVVLDAGTNLAAAAVEADRRLLVVRACYLALRRAVTLSVRPDAVVLVAEHDRAITAADIESALGVPVAAEITIDPAVARSIDAGLFAARLPRALRRATEGLVLEPDRARR